ncbi:hypothetical protein [Bacteriovorax sp. DB6_IX]|uniref:hypothetical protein n=1 Tax=Bacteriovorax sp. DB6_IX TaxID=1353530 RepID=UPI00038A482F|nr:hypothetical protein [Bacteriovorax sp. DB6_IX]EQC51519.1 hypothetical protein M901_0975 [Bacteriovorax sp. DB6_IX]
MKATNFYKKMTLAALLSGSFLVFGGIYQGMKVTDTSFMNDTEVKFAKRFDETQERVVASAERELKAIQYLPVNDQNNALINGKWQIIRIEDEKGEEVYNTNKSENKIVVDMELIKTSQIMINDKPNYLFDLSFLHESGKTIALFRSFGKGYEIIEARRYKEAKYIQSVTQVETNEVLGKLEKENVVRSSEATSEPLTLERAMIPALGNKLLIGDQFVMGDVTVTEKSIQGLAFEARNEKGESKSYVIGDIELEAGGSFVTEIEGQESRGVVTNNGKDAFRIRFATGPLKGSLLNFVTDNELERIRMEQEEIERLKEEKSYEASIVEDGLEQVQEKAAESRKVIDASYQEKQPEVEQYDEELEQEEYAEEFQEAIEGEEEMMVETERQGFAF